MHTSRRVRSLSLMSLLGVIATGPLTLSQLQAQAQASDPNHTTFEVASIKLNKDRGNSYGQVKVTAGGISSSGATLVQLIGEAYQVPFGRISGLDATVSDSLQKKYDVTAKASNAVSREQVRRMLQSLLSDRFKLQLHRQSQVQSIYELTVQKTAPKFIESPKGSEEAPFMLPRTDDSQVHGYTTEFHNFTMARFSAILSNYMDRPVIDLTRLDGTYNFTLQLEGIKLPDKGTGTPESWSSSSIFSDIQTQLGLKLQAAKAPVEYLIVDHSELPSEN